MIRPEKKFKDKIDSIVQENIPYESKLSTYKEDTNESFDLIYSLKGLCVSVRIRKYTYFIQHKDFTIRSRSRKGDYCELDKLVDGKSDWYFYGWENKDRTDLIGWILIDINDIRHDLLKRKKRNAIPNVDGTYFISFTIDELEKDYNALIDCSNNI